MPRLVAQSPEFAGKSFDLSGPEITIGRLEDNGVQMEHASISGHHAVLNIDGLDYVIKDLDSTNGTRINGEKITKQKLRRNDVLRLGNIEVLYDSEHAPPGQPMPTPSERVNLNECATKGIPEGFSNASPVPKKSKHAEKGVMTWVILGLALLAAGGLGYFVYVVLVTAPPTGS